ncbi:short-chain dehydrogenase reductase sdr [Colletotrichum truncatum]|uniref:Short-chain dehydrogenase reductase sdr n=1 Tax=Colletotrichum truncatum TaxID=5467 RepID=A0ACC3ZCV6_COLTU|nr:short-chain dehydrogenase reductase sdr [Colletotrichum truncatum]KAF6797890.1 short-chain dehydrogenase reductase sdr [Colletotrichum truncatum]
MAKNIQKLPAYLTRIFGLVGRTAVITGGSSGIGKEIAFALGQSGAKVILIARREPPLASTLEQLKQLGVPATSISADLSNLADLNHAVSRIKTSHGTPDILVNAAGVSHRPPLSHITQAEWDFTIAANLTAPFALGQAFGPAMAERGSGRIINVASQQAFRAFGNSGAYGAAKGGVVALTRSQAEAWSRKGVLCNAIAPGVVETPMTAEVLADPKKKEVHAARTMIGRNGVPEDFAGAAIWLASDASAAVTGQTIFVDGGYSAT